MSARSSVLEMIETAEEQGYRTVDKGSGTWMIYAPVCRPVVPGYESVAIHIPRSDSGNALQVIRSNLRRAGVKFSEDIARERIHGVQTQAREMSKLTMIDTVPPPRRQPPDPIDALIQICNRQAEMAAESAGLLEQVRKHVKDKAAQADQVLAAFDLLAKARDGR